MWMLDITVIGLHSFVAVIAIGLALFLVAYLESRVYKWRIRPKERKPRRRQRGSPVRNLIVISSGRRPVSS
jgi:hypothetical protein